MAADRRGLSRASSANRINTAVTGSNAKPNVSRHPYAAANLGASSVESNVPEFPAPAMPIAKP
jgi:hypothetical protein